MNVTQVDQQFALGNQLLQQGRLDEAIACFSQFIALVPLSAEGHNNLGTALLKRGRLEEAFASYQRAIEINPEFADAYYNLGTAFQSQGLGEIAMACYRRALAIQPRLFQAYIALGALYQERGQTDEAVAAYQQALALAPDYAMTHNNLATTLGEQGRLDEAFAAYQRAFALQPDYVSAHSNLLYLLNFHPASDPATSYEAHRRWNELHATPLARHVRPHENNRDAKRRLRIGYVSPDFRRHCQSFFTVPLLSEHDHQQFEIVCYSDVASPDEMTQRISTFADHWRSIRGLTDAQVAEIVRQDRIDILVDLTMHMSGGRPLLFARRSAPVQVCWLAYPGTTGQTSIDYRLTDPYLDPPGLDDRFYSEQSVRLPDTFWCYRPYSDEPNVNALPAATNGYITFGSLNNFVKVNEPTLQLWSQVLRAVLGSRLIMLAPEGSCRERTLAYLTQYGAAPDQIHFVGRQPTQLYMARYHQIDIGLDTIPYNGHTTSLDSTWMGVPVITLAGNTVVGRAGVSQLSNLGLTELIAHSPNEFVAIATGLANDLPRLSNLRQTLRPRMLASPLMDAPRFAQNMEAAFREMWRTWCGK